MREVERQVMLRIIDQRWREHLEEMDYLQEGINLRAMGQKDPLVEWQREGYEMFGQLMKGIAQDFVRYVMHVQVVRKDDQPATVVRTCSRRLGDDAPTDGFAAAAQAAAASGRDRRPRPSAAGSRPRRRRSSSRPSSRTSGRRRRATRRARAARGKKFKLCHGADRLRARRVDRCVTSPTT